MIKKVTNVLCEFSQQGKLATITLNRPEQHNSINVGMFEELQKHFQDMHKYNTQVVLLRGTGHNLSAGGDVKSAYLAKHDPSPQCPADTLQKLFSMGYAQAYKWASMEPILVPFFEGITVGGVVGWTAYSNFRIATEKTILAIPELRIGYFIDCGGAHWIHQRKHCVGQFLGYTGHRLRGADVVHSGMADYFVASETTDALHQDLIRMNVTDIKKSNVVELKQILGKYNVTQLPEYGLKAHQKDISQWFSSTTIEDLYEKLMMAEKSDFTRQVIKMLLEQNPLSLKLMVDYLKRSKKLTLREVYQIDYHLSQKFMKKNDFFEGVKSVLVDKQHKPAWQFNNVSLISDEEVNQYFQNMKPKLGI